MTRLTFTTATPFQRVQMLEEALEMVLNRDGMRVASGGAGEANYVWVLNSEYEATRTGHSLHQIARELEALLP